MRIFSALKVSKIRWLWGGQVFSAMGDEVYNIALVWYATSLLGTKAGYISAVQAGSIFIFGLAGSVWADRYDHRRVMIVVDILRGIAVLTLPIFSLFSPLNLWVVIPVAVIVSSLTAFFNPALAALIPQLTKDSNLLQATNSLMETTSRLARVIGPGFVGLVNRQIPLIHYFTANALSYFISAISVSRVKPDPSLVIQDQGRLDFRATLFAGYSLSRSRPILTYSIYSGALSGAAWIFVLPLGMTLLLHDKIPTNVGGLGLLISAYGFGNILSNVVISNFHFQRPELWIFTGRVIAGTGILFLSISSTLEEMMLASAVTAVGGPLTDLGYINFIQKICTGRDIARLFRYIMVISQGSLLVVYLTSPRLFQVFSVPTVVAFAGALVFFTGLLGFAIVGTKR